MTTPPNDFDSPWKDATDEYLQGFFALFHPNIHADIELIGSWRCLRWRRRRYAKR